MNTSLTFFLRNHLPELPYSLGRQVAKIPYQIRPGIGKNYRAFKKAILKFENYNIEQRKKYIFERIKSITCYAYNNIVFYHDLYSRQKFNPEKLKSFSDIKYIPVTTKAMFMEYDLADRSNPGNKSMLINTGGSCGKPLALYVPPLKLAVEWSHLHYVWKKQMNFDPAEIKLLLVGRSNVRDTVMYDFIRNSLRVDIYKPFSLISEKIIKRFRNIPISIIHGYPSVIYELAIYCQNDKPLLDLIRKSLKGIIFCSEYPYELKRMEIEEIFKVKSHAFYGHGEGSVMAYETSVNNYVPVHTYGYVESISEGERNYLTGTSYYNTSTPFIRYNTEDSIRNVVFDEDVLKSFSISEGRPDDYVTDRNGKKISLTGLIYGRHHQLFNYCSFIQIKQDSPGFACIYYTLKKTLSKDPKEFFDASNIEIDFSFQARTEPFRTVSGKVKLLV